MLSRRKFSASALAMIAAVASLSAPSPIGAWPAHGIAATGPVIPAFLGNPNVTITGINTTGGIVCSRTSGNTPCFVKVSASAITAIGTSKPYEDLDFRWNFGEPLGVETFTNPGVGGGTVNANINQVAPEAAYCYRTAGTYTITLTITGNGFGPVTVTQTITVSDFNSLSPTIRYLDSNATGANNGTTKTDAWTSIASANTFIGTGSNVWLQIACNSVFSGTTGLQPWQASASSTLSGLRISSYGTGAMPRIDVSSGSGNTLILTNSTPTTKSDIVISGILFTTSGTSSLNGNASCNVLAGTSKTIQNLYFDNVTVAMNYDGSSPTTDQNNMTVQQQGAVGTLVNWGFWNVNLTGPASVSSGINTQGLFTSGTTDFFYVGGSISGNCGSAVRTLNHHIYPDCQQRSLYQWINFGAGSNRSFCINTNWNGTGSLPLEFCEFLCFSQNNMTGTQRAHDAGQANNDPMITQYRNMVCQLNNIHDLTAEAIVFSNVLSYTHRYNNWYNNASICYQPDGVTASILQTSWYGNKMWNNATASGAMINLIGSTFSVTISNASPALVSFSSNYAPLGTKIKLTGSVPSPFVSGNFYYINSVPTPGSTCTLSATPYPGTDINSTGSGSGTLLTVYTSPQTFTNNIIEDTRATSPAPVIVAMTWADQVSAGTVFNKNQYWAPNATGGPANPQAWNNVSTAEAWTTWQGTWDAAGSLANPNWVNPAIGQF